MDLKAVKAGGGRYKQRKRVGRGSGSGLGKTSGRGSKGQKARSGWRLRRGFEGGQMPLMRRIPKRGFSNARFRHRFCVVNVGQLNAFDDDQTVNLQTLRERGLARGGGEGLKVLGDGELTRRLTVEARGFSASAVAKIEAAGGRVVRLPGPRRPVRRKMRSAAPPAEAAPAGPAPAATP